MGSTTPITRTTKATNISQLFADPFSTKLEIITITKTTKDILMT